MNDAAGVAAITQEDVKPSEALRRLADIPLLRALPPEEVQELVICVEQLDVPAGTRLIARGDVGDALYLIEQGSARIERDGRDVIKVGAGTVVGEAALLTGERRNATVTAESELVVWRVGREAFTGLVEKSPNLRQALHALVEARKLGTPIEAPSKEYWLATAKRAVEARNRNLTLWEILMAVGVVAWLALFVNERAGLVAAGEHHALFAAIELVTGLLLIQGSCEAFIHGVERLGARLRWDGFIAGTAGSVLSTLPEFVVIAFLVQVDPLAAFVTAAVTIYNNALAFSIYSFFLPRLSFGRKNE